MPQLPNTSPLLDVDAISFKEVDKHLHFQLPNLWWGESSHAASYLSYKTISHQEMPLVPTGYSKYDTTSLPKLFVAACVRWSTKASQSRLPLSPLVFKTTGLPVSLKAKLLVTVHLEQPISCSYIQQFPAKLPKHLQLVLNNDTIPSATLGNLFQVALYT